MRKPKNLGTENKNAGCLVTGTQCGMETAEGKIPMRAKRLTSEMGGTAGCTVRLAEIIEYEDGYEFEGKEGILGDSWFGSVRCAAELGHRNKKAILAVSVCIYIYIYILVS